MADNELQQIINKMIADNKESWKKEFLSIYPTYEKRVAALKAMLQEYNDNWKRQFESGNFVKNEFPPAWLSSESKSNLDKFFSISSVGKLIESTYLSKNFVNLSQISSVTTYSFNSVITVSFSLLSAFTTPLIFLSISFCNILLIVK